MLNTIPTTETVKVDSYPYGRLRCTAFFSMEFDKKKGFRSVFQTIDPKTGRHNKPKKSTYYDLGIQYKEAETEHIKFFALSFNGVKELNRAVKFIAEHYDKFTPEQIEYFGILCLSMAKVSMKASVVYCGSTLEQLKPIFDGFMETITKCVSSKENHFADASIDFEAYESCKDPNFNPWKITSR